jgi:hypothetical protein
MNQHLAGEKPWSVPPFPKGAELGALIRQKLGRLGYEF